MESTVLTYLLIALAALGIVAVFVLIRTLGKLGETAEALTVTATSLSDTAKSATATSEEARAAVSTIRQQIAPTMNKVDAAVDAVNANLLRLDSIMGDVESMTGQVANASHAVSNLANAPVDVLTGLAERFRKAWRVRKAEVSDDVARYSETISHAAQQAGHVEYAPSGTAATASDYATAAEPVRNYATAADLVATSDDFAGEAYYETPAETLLYEDAVAVETDSAMPIEPDVDAAEADFSSEDISHFSAAAVAVADDGDEAGDEAVES